MYEIDIFSESTRKTIDNENAINVSVVQGVVYLEIFL